MENQYTIKKVGQISELQNAFENGFIDLFDECFNTAPYFLKYPDSELFEIFSNHFKAGFVLLAYLDEKMVGFAGSRELLADEYVADEVKTFLNEPENYYYHSDVGVAKTQRGKGLARILIKETINHTPVGKIIMRTKEDNRPSINLHIKMNFKPIEATQTIKRKNSLGEDINDKRIYLVYNKEDNFNV